MQSVAEPKKRRVSLNGNQLVLIGAIVAIVAIFSLINKNFFSIVNMNNILIASTLIGLVAIGHTYLILIGANDLSPGSVAAFSGVLVAVMMTNWNLPPILAVVLTLALSLVAGILNAAMVNHLKITPFIATMITQTVWRGFAYIICNGKSVVIGDKLFLEFGKARLFGLQNAPPYTVLLMLVCWIFFGFVLAKTRFGRSLYALGGNSEAARLAGINPKRATTICFLLMAVFSALGGIILAARMNAGQPIASNGLEFDSITACVLGGVSFTGGVGTLLGAALGALLIQTFNTGLTMLGVPTFWQFVARGALLCIALSIDFVQHRMREHRQMANSIRTL